MQEKKQPGKKKRLQKVLGLLLAIVLMCGMIPIESALAEENETSQETEAVVEEVMEPDTDTESDSEDVENTESDSEEEIPEEPAEPVTYANSISGTIWLDANEDGVCDGNEDLVAGYEVSLYVAADTSDSVKTAVTNEDGEYTFTNLTPDDYVVGVSLSQTVGDTNYLVPLVGISGDNKFVLDKATYSAYTEIITIAADTEASDYNAGVRLPPSIQTMSVGIQPKSSTAYTVNGTVIGFAGHEWWVIGDPGGGVTSPQADAVTLWAKNQDFGAAAFDSTPPYSNDYNGSTLKSTMNALDTSLFTSGNTNEKNYVINRASMDLLDENGVNSYGYSAVTNQKFWPLSYQEWNTVSNTTVKGSFPGSFWLRMPYSTNVYATGCGYLDTLIGISILINSGVRPAFYLNLSSVLFTSDASGAGIKSATAGSPSLEAAVPPTGTIKLTMTDDSSLALNTTTTLITAPPSGGSRTFDYSNATTGANKSVSIMICDQGTGDILYYGRPVDLNGGSGSGTATFTVPSGLAIGDYTMKVFNEEVNGDNYTDYASTPQQFTLRITAATVGLSANPDTTKVYAGTVDITAVVGNHTAHSASTIEDLEWFRVPVSDTNDYSSSFDSTYSSSAIASADKGVIPDPGTSEITETFGLTVDKNATYWFKGTVKDGATTYTAVECITVDNLYEPTPLAVRGEIDGSSPTAYLYGYETVSGTYGIPYDLDGTTVLTAPSLGFDTVTLDARSQYAGNWTSAMKSGTGVPLALTLDGAFLSNTECDSGDITKYTIVYTKRSNWQNITAHFVDGSDVPLTAVNSLTSEPFPAPLDAGGDVTAFQSSGGSYLPPAVTNYTVIGYKVGSTGTFVPLTNFASFDPVIPVTSSGITDVYIVYQADTTELTIDKTVTGAYGDPNKLFEITITLKDGGTPVSGTYTCTGALTSITFNASGQGTLNLKHGETVTIEDIPQNYTCTVQETDALVTGGIYDVTYTGTGTVTGSGSSAYISETLGAAAATVSITNDRSAVPTSGLSGTNDQLAAMGILAVLAAAVVLLWSYRRRKKCI